MSNDNRSLAYVNSIFPKLTATFIYREVFELRRRGMDIKVYSIHKPNPAELSEEAKPLCNDTYYLLPIKLTNLFWCHLRFLLKNPFRYVATLYKMIAGTYNSGKDRIRGFMHFAEGVVLADKMLVDGVTYIHAHYASQPASVSRVVHLLLKIPYSFTAHAHDIWNDQLLLPEKLHEAVFAVCCTRLGVEKILRHTKEDVSHKVHLVYHGLDINKFVFGKDTAKREENLILSVGALGETKGFPDLIQACAILKERSLSIQCVIIGEGVLRPKLEELIYRYKLEEQVALIGALPQEKVMEYYFKSWVFCLPCVTTSDDNHDGLPNVIVEAMATGLPVVTTDNAGQVELIEDGKHGFLVSQYSPVKIADAIQKLCTDFETWKKIQYQARKRIEEDFDSQKTNEPLFDLLKNANKISV